MRATLVLEARCLLPAAVLSGLLLLSAVPAAGAPRVEMPAGTMQCDFMAWVSFGVKAPVAVRAEPAPDAKLLGYLPVLSPAQEERPNVEFDVVAVRAGWLKIDPLADPVELDADGRPLPSRTVPQGAGWIAAEAAQVGIQSAIGYARSDADSAVIVDLGDDWLTDMGTLEAIRGCAGPWLLIEYQLVHSRSATGALLDLPVKTQKKETAWFRGICSNQATTCDQRSVDQRK
jgi:hypothetical protein